MSNSQAVKLWLKIETFSVNANQIIKKKFGHIAALENAFQNYRQFCQSLKELQNNLNKIMPIQLIIKQNMNIKRRAQST